MVVLLDLVCTSLVGGRNWKCVSFPELWRLLPALLAGVALGTTTLAGLGPKWPLIALGAFVLVVAVRNVLPSRGDPQVLHGLWAAPFGVAGGIFSALFGTGGPVYTIYLSRRLFDAERFRATISLIILASGVSRAVAFGAAGLYQQQAILSSALMALPFCLSGLYIGSRLRHKVSAASIRRGLFALLALGGCGAMYRGMVS